MTAELWSRGQLNHSAAALSGMTDGESPELELCQGPLTYSGRGAPGHPGLSAQHPSQKQSSGGRLVQLAPCVGSISGGDAQHR